MHTVWATFIPRITPGKRPGLRMLLGAFRGGNPLERIVGVPSLWQRPGGVLQQHGLGVLRQIDSEQANFRVARDPGGIRERVKQRKERYILGVPRRSTPRGVYSMGRSEITPKFADLEISMKKLLCVVLWFLPEIGRA